MTSQMERYRSDAERERATERYCRSKAAGWRSSKAPFAPDCAEEWNRMAEDAAQKANALEARMAELVGTEAKLP